MSTYDVKS